MKQELAAGKKSTTAELIAWTENAINEAFVEADKAAEALAEFKRDKRAFVVDYINTQVHGPDWRSK